MILIESLIAVNLTIKTWQNFALFVKLNSNLSKIIMNTIGKFTRGDLFVIYVASLLSIEADC